MLQILSHCFICASQHSVFWVPAFMQCLLSSLCFCPHSGLSASSPAAATAATTAATAAAAKSEEVHPELAAAG